MALLMRKRTILAKIESTYATDPVPTGGANAILIKNLTVTPQETTLAPREVVRPYLGNFQNIAAAVYAKIDFEVELAGAGTAGTAPAYGPLLRACGLAETILAAPLTGTATAGSTTTATLAAGASAVDNAYKGMRIDITGGAGSGQSATILAYNGTTKVATFNETLGVALTATSVYNIGAQVSYTPVSAAFESNTLYFNEDGLLHKVTGARGTVSLPLPLMGIPSLKLSFTGLYQPVTDTAAPTVTLTAFQLPLAVNNANTTGLNLQGFTAGVLADLSVDLANTVTYRNLVGGTEQVLITDRKPAGSITIEATTVAAKDWWTGAKNAVTGPLSVLHGVAAGNKVQIAAPAVQLTKPNYSDKDGVAMLQFGLVLCPVSGNDEFSLSVF